MTIATNTAPTTNQGHKVTNTTYLVATANDTTASGSGPTITNVGGRIKRINLGVVCTNGTGTSPTVTATLKGSLDNTTFFSVLDSAGSAIATAAVTAAATNSGFVDTNTKGITSFPPYIRVDYAVGGSSTPGWTGKIMYEADYSA